MVKISCFFFVVANKKENKKTTITTVMYYSNYIFIYEQESIQSLNNYYKH